MLSLFNDINKVQSASKTQVFELMRLFREDSPGFERAWEQAYLKVFKVFHDKGNRRIPPKSEQLATTFFTELLASDANGGVLLYNAFVGLLAEAVFSSISGIKLTSARMLFHLVKLGADHVDREQRKEVLRAVFQLLRQKVTTYRQVGIKLASLVLKWKHDLRNKIEDELFRIMAVDDNEQIRKMALTNIWLTSTP